MVGLIILAVLVIIIVAIISLYNGLVQARLKVDNAWSQIDVQLQRRFDLIPNFGWNCKRLYDTWERNFRKNSCT